MGAADKAWGRAREERGKQVVTVNPGLGRDSTLMMGDVGVFWRVWMQAAVGIGKATEADGESVQGCGAIWVVRRVGWGCMVARGVAHAVNRQCMVIGVKEEVNIISRAGRGECSVAVDRPPGGNAKNSVRVGDTKPDGSLKAVKLHMEPQDQRALVNDRGGAPS